MTTPASPPAPTAQTTQTPANAQVVQAAIQEIAHIATLPEVTMKIIQLVEDPDSTAQDLNNVITNDPALGARILKVVNSAFYGLPGQIGSINRAVVLLGLNAVKNIAIAASLAKLFRGGKISETFDARDLWVNAVASGTATRLLAEQVRLGLPDEAFLAGLIHDIGIMVEIQARRPQFIEVIEQFSATGGDFCAIETEVIGANHQEFGSGLCKLWKFPQSFQHVCGNHHNPMALPAENRMLACLVNVADCLTKRLELGFSQATPSDVPSADVMAATGLTDAMLADVANRLPDAMEEAKGIFAG